MHTQPEPSSLGTQLLPVAENGQKLFLAAASLQVHAFKAMMRFNVETLAFLKHRCEQDVRLADDLISGPQFNDAFDIFAAFVQNATSQYVIEAGKVAALTSRLASETARNMRKGARIAIEDAAAKTVV
ncbi:MULTISPECIES: phasin family protein [unclassified Mesorhizobium]|uniref:phasin family protein n=1 Tax=unclassified Mesorhizobium TaxID=325217 RepID=UPI00112C4D07|nr:MULTISPECIES: phasin family protein [unclassified Mesorhizobium]TPJ41020.1 phasin family protein [Mesorhizobium sp. B2-6-6]TPK06664.1 phasin family protein [Mesorhizobium sp. B2-5-11]TPL39155.1 phasin family protein [Mesorhizobium sp. B2-4-5]TPM17433.1 phasin family protein [Mesorhizobium sp. B2-3-6]TPN75765.1 phasin family protein [Mesorhizobium sp. B1-1-2]